MGFLLHCWSSRVCDRRYTADGSRSVGLRFDSRAALAGSAARPGQREAATPFYKSLTWGNSVLPNHSEIRFKIRPKPGLNRLYATKLGRRVLIFVTG